MKNPFADRMPTLGGPARDMIPIVPSDVSDLSTVAVGLYIETGGSVTVVTEAGETRTIVLPDFAVLPVGVRRVLATGTDATGLHAFAVS